MKILVSTDTSCLLNYDSLNKYNIRVFPLNVIIDGEEYLDGVNIKQDFLLEKMLGNKIIKTSTPPLGEVISYFEKIFEEGYDEVIHFTISSKLSSMYNLFSSVSENYFDNKIKVIDALSVSSAMLSSVFYAYDAVQNNVPTEEIIKVLEQRKSDYHLFFIPENLTALKNGGRISPAVAAIGNTIGLKPVIQLKDGELVKSGMTLNVKKAFKDKLESLLEKYSQEKYDYTLVEFGSDPTARSKILPLLHEKIGEDKLITGFLPINVSAHTGPGTIGLVVSPKINNVSLKNYL